MNDHGHFLAPAVLRQIRCVVASKRTLTCILADESARIARGGASERVASARELVVRVLQGKRTSNGANTIDNRCSNRDKSVLARRPRAEVAKFNGSDAPLHQAVSRVLPRHLTSREAKRDSIARARACNKKSCSGHPLGSHLRPLGHEIASPLAPSFPLILLLGPEHPPAARTRR